MFLSGSAFAATSYRDSCGADSKVLNTTTLVHNGAGVTFTTVSCPGFADLETDSSTSLTRRSRPQKRQVEQCNNGGCTLDCANLSEYQPFVYDCQTITDTLESYYPAEFLAPPQTMSYWSYYSCQYTYYNLDTEYEYEVCYINFGYDGAIIADDCFGDWPAPSSTAGGVCVSPGTEGNDWAIEVSYPS